MYLHYCIPPMTPLLLFPDRISFYFSHLSYPKVERYFTGVNPYSSHNTNDAFECSSWSGNRDLVNTCGISRIKWKCPCHSGFHTPIWEKHPPWNDGCGTSVYSKCKVSAACNCQKVLQVLLDKLVFKFELLTLARCTNILSCDKEDFMHFLCFLIIILNGSF